MILFAIVVGTITPLSPWLKDEPVSSLFSLKTLFLMKFAKSLISLVSISNALSSSDILSSSFFLSSSFLVSSTNSLLCSKASIVLFMASISSFNWLNSFSSSSVNALSSAFTSFSNLSIWVTFSFFCSSKLFIFLFLLLLHLEYSHILSNLFFQHPHFVVVQALPHLLLFLYNLHELL